MLTPTYAYGNVFARGCLIKAIGDNDPVWPQNYCLCSDKCVSGHSSLICLILLIYKLNTTLVSGCLEAGAHLEPCLQIVWNIVDSTQVLTLWVQFPGLQVVLLLSRFSAVHLILEFVFTLKSISVVQVNHSLIHLSKVQSCSCRTVILPQAQHELSFSLALCKVALLLALILPEHLLLEHE